MKAHKFTVRWLAAVIMLLLFVLAFPFVLPPLVRATGCEKVGGACGAIAVALGIYLRLPVAIGVGAYLAFLTWKRSKLVGAHPWVFVFVVLMYFAALPFLFAFGNFWGASFALGVISVAGPFAVLAMLLATLIALSCLPDGAKAWHGAPRLATLLAGAIALLFTFDQWLTGLTLVPIIGGLLRSVLLPILRIMGPLLHSVGVSGSFVVTLAMIVSLAFWVIAARKLGVRVVNLPSN